MADRLDATGILLVGGASERFGSPKALARFRSETLAERAWRLLHEVCDEVLAVGKDALGLELPFPVLEDRAVEHVPVHGVIAGLRAASHEACLALPVDCPLVTADALRALAEATRYDGPHGLPFAATFLDYSVATIAAAPTVVSNSTANVGSSGSVMRIFRATAKPATIRKMSTRPSSRCSGVLLCSCDVAGSGLATASDSRIH